MSVLLKAAHTLVECLSDVALALISTSMIANLADWFTQSALRLIPSICSTTVKIFLGSGLSQIVASVSPRFGSLARHAKAPPGGPGGALGDRAQSPLRLLGRDQMRVKPSPSASSKRLAKIGALKLGSSSLSER